MSVYDLRGKSVLVTGGAGFLGQAVCQELEKHHAQSIRVPRSSSHDLRIPAVCREVVEGIDIVIHLAARVGGIGLNREKPGELFYDNIVMGVHLMEALSSD